jgi:hypothetical protein
MLLLLLLRRSLLLLTMTTTTSIVCSALLALHTATAMLHLLSILLHFLSILLLLLLLTFTHGRSLFASLQPACACVLMSAGSKGGVGTACTTLLLQLDCHGMSAQGVRKRWRRAHRVTLCLAQLLALLLLDCHGMGAQGVRKWW